VETKPDVNMFITVEEFAIILKESEDSTDYVELGRLRKFVTKNHTIIEKTRHSLDTYTAWDFCRYLKRLGKIREGHEITEHSDD
jgi:hypothetical protein